MMGGGNKAHLGGHDEDTLTRIPACISWSVSGQSSGRRMAELRSMHAATSRPAPMMTRTGDVCLLRLCMRRVFSLRVEG